MNDHHLDDLIIGDPEPASGKSKTLLTIIALLIVILIIGLILWALLFNSSDSQAGNKAATTQQTKPLAPDLIPLDKNNKELTVEKQEKQSDIQKQQTQTAKTAPKPKPKPAQNKVETKPTPKPAQQITKTEQKTPEPAQKTETKKTQIIKNAGKTIYYVQVGAFKRDPSPKFIQKLKDNGFTFITKISKGIRRVRVGPYDSYQEAKNALPQIKTKLGVDGLIVKY